MALQTKTYSQGSLAYGSASNGYVLELVLTEESVDQAANTSLVSYKLQLRSGSNNRFDWELTGKLSLDGSQAAAKTEEKYLDYNSVWVLLQGQTTVAHGTDGTKRLPFSATITPYNGGNSYTPPAMTLTGTLALTAIARESTLSATPAYIEDAATIAVARSSGSYTHSIRYQFGSLSGYLGDNAGALTDTETRLTATTIVFPIPERFYEQIPDAPSGTCTLTCKTYSGTTQIGQARTATFTVTADPARCGPVVSGTALDTDSAVTALTGSDRIFVKGRSDVACTVSATAQKGAVIKALYANGVLLDGNTRTIEDITTAQISFRAEDSRGYSAQYTVPELSLVSYVPVSATVAAKRDDPTSGRATLTVTGKWFPGSFGSAENALTVQYRLAGGDWVSLTPALADGSYEAVGALTGMDYTRSHTIEVQVADRLDRLTKTVTLGKGVPVFDWGEQDFVFHVPVTFTAADGTQFALALENGQLTAVVC